MTVETVSFTADDAALAISMMTDRNASTIEYVDQDSYNVEFNQIERKIRNLVQIVMNVHGVAINGDEDDGDPKVAERILLECASYEKDPLAYIEEFERSATPPPQTPTESAAHAVATPVMTMPPASVPEAALIGEAFGTTMMPYVQPETRPVVVRFVERGIRDVFQGLPMNMSPLTVPVAHWKNEAPEKIPESDEHFHFDPFAVRVMSIAMRNRKNVIAVGDPGCGKTEFFKQFAARVGLPFYKIAMDGSISRSDLLGSFRQVVTPTGSATPFVMGLLPTIIQSPCIIDFDEMDQCDPDLQYVLHSLYEGDGLDLKEDGGRFVKRHENCYLVATANTKGRGSENGLTHSRYEMSEATRERYSYWLNFTYMAPEDEIRVVSKKTGLSEAYSKMLVTLATSMRDSYKTGVISQTCSTRQLLDTAPLAQGLGYDPLLDLALACDVVMSGRANSDDIPRIRDFIKMATDKDLNTVAY